MVSRCVCQSAPVRALVVPVCCERGLYLKNSFSTAPGECFDELREAHTQLVSNHDLTDKCQRSWRTQVVCREVVSPGTAINEAKAEPRFRFYPHGLTPAVELLPLAQFSSTNEFLHQAQRRYTSGAPC